VRPWWRAAIVLLACSGADCGRSVPGQPAPPAAGVLRGANVLLVTIDTLRADRVGAYGSPLGITPTLDRFAAEGLRYEIARAHVPLTLPSHATVMTGRYPFANGVRDNGSFRFDGSHPTLAGTLKQAGYSTAAFVGAFVLDGRFGLNAGFDLYDDRMRGSGSNLDVVQRTAEQVLAPATDWILQHDHRQPSADKSPPWFGWIHLYDPHEPYTPPEPFRTRYAGDPYAGEIAYTDAVLGQFLDRLRSSGALDHTLVVIASDHGESLGEHGERTHGLFAYDVTLRVPLILWAKGALQPAVSRSPSRLVDLMPTVLDLVGVPVPPAIDGRSLRAVPHRAVPADDPGTYFEALNANLTRGWAPLKGMVHGKWKVIDLPIPELYDVTGDAGETSNLYASKRAEARDVEARLDRASAGAASPAPATVDAAAAARLRSLGYIVGSAPKPSRAYTAADDPKRLAHLNAALDDAVDLWSRGDGARAIETLRAVIRERPDLTVAYDRLAFMLRASGRIGDAVGVLDDAARAGHADRALLRSLGSALGDAGDFRRSAAVLEPLVREDGSDLQSSDALGQTYARMGRGPQAEAMFKRVLEASPNAAATWNNLGALYLSQNRTAEAIEALSRAITINPDLAAAYNGLGVAYAKGGQINRAVEQWQKALALRPDFADARYNLDRAARK
jgi:arylsulfatase A-like enzyme/Flp pilus assembly protein TadD